MITYGSIAAIITCSDRSASRMYGLVLPDMDPGPNGGVDGMSRPTPAHEVHIIAQVSGQGYFLLFKVFGSAQGIPDITGTPGREFGIEISGGLRELPLASQKCDRMGKYGNGRIKIIVG
jgi:hypothetical protein